jgi:hypothetical protein
MAIVVNFIKDYASWVYGACALVALWYLRVVLVARRDRRHAVFTLERESALNRVYGAWTVTVAVIILMGLVYLLSTVVFDAVRPLVQEAEQPSIPQVAGGSPTATPTLPLPEMTPPTDTPTPRPRPTNRPAPTPVPQVTPTAVVRVPHCPDPRAVITSPGLGATVSGMVPVLGTAVHEAFQFYKLEYGIGERPDNWSYFDGGERPVGDGRLGTLNAGALPPGTYSIRIVVVDSTGNFPPPCQTTIVIR